ncbi:MAG: PH domain-containing protein [Anaerolineae bacterium]|nr:PH domain-containing protein [Anaerolineae bacterium]
MKRDAYLESLLGEREKILLIARQHWLLLLREVLIESIAILALLVLVTLIWVLWLPNPLIALGYLLLIFPILSLLRDVTVWTNHKYVVTTHRVIQIFGVFNKNVTDSSLEKVNDVKMEQSALGRLFNYGDIEILTASEFGINRFTRISNPIHFKTAMLNAKERLEGGRGEPAKRLPTDVPALIAELDALRQRGVLTDVEFAEKKAELLARL